MGIVLIALFDVGRSSLKLRGSLVLDPSLCKRREKTGQWWRMPLIPALGRQRQVDLREFEASLVYTSEFQDSHGSYTEKPCL